MFPSVQRPAELSFPLTSQKHEMPILSSMPACQIPEKKGVNRRKNRQTRNTRTDLIASTSGTPREHTRYLYNKSGNRRQKPIPNMDNCKPPRNSDQSGTQNPNMSEHPKKRVTHEIRARAETATTAGVRGGE